MSKNNDAIDDGEKAFLRSAGLGDAHIQWRSSTFPDDMTILDWFAGQEKPIPDSDSRMGPAVMGCNPPQWGTSHEGNLACIKWWAEADARYRYIRAAAMIAEKRRREGGAE